MPTKTRQIGLSLGADICWPICFEALLKELDLGIPMGGDTLRFEAERVSIEPFDIRQPVRYDVLIDRLTHWYHTAREWIKKAIVANDLYVFNNPFTLTSMEKHTSYSAMARLGFPVPETWMIPPKSYVETPDLQLTLKSYARLFDLGSLGDHIGYPLFMKPYDGGAWVGVSAIKDRQALMDAYEESGTRVMHLQAGVPHDLFIRCVGLGPQWRFVNYDPDAPLHDRYRMDHDFLSAEDQTTLSRMTMVINAFFGWDFNSCEALRNFDGIWQPIDFANACPDSQVTSLHYHFPWLIKANLKWSIFCAAYQRKMQTDLNWPAYFEIAERDIPFDEKLAAYAEIAMARFDAARFEDFCAEHLGHLDEVAYDFFGTDVVRDAIRKKVTVLFPEHEIDEFTELFWQRIQTWREQEGKAGVVSPK